MSRHGADEPRLLTYDQCETMTQNVLRWTTKPYCKVSLSSQVNGRTKFVRGDTHVSTEAVKHTIAVLVADADGRIGFGYGSAITEEGLRATIRNAEAALGEHTPAATFEEILTYDPGPTRPGPSPKVYFEDLFSAMTPERRLALVQTAMEASERASLIGAGDVSYELQGGSTANSKGFFAYDRQSFADFSLTARTKDGTGSGWGWSGFEDWSRVQVHDVIARAVDLGQRSANPVAVEPGRYTVVLEPSAVAALVDAMTSFSYGGMSFADNGYTAYGRTPVGKNKIGMQMIDARIDIWADPWDPDIPSSTFDPWAENATIVRAPWFERGALKNLIADADYAEPRGFKRFYPARGRRLQVDMPPQSLDEMIASTKRGIWVNRLSGVDIVNWRTLLLTGTTRDGTFLIENGKITKSIKNFRFNESPFFVLNKLEAAGIPVRASRTMVVPRLKVRDFDFTSLTDAV